MDTLDLLNKKVNVIKNHDFNKEKWKNLINITCDIYEGGGLGYSIKIIKDGKTFDECIILGFTPKMLASQKEYRQPFLPVLEKISKEYTEAHVAAIEEALIEFDEFLSNEFSPQDGNKATNNEDENDIIQAVILTKDKWKDKVEMHVDIYSDGAIGYAIHVKNLENPLLVEFYHQVFTEDFLLKKTILKMQIESLRSQFNNIREQLGKEGFSAIWEALDDFDDFINELFDKTRSHKEVNKGKWWIERDKRWAKIWSFTSNR